MIYQVSGEHFWFLPLLIPIINSDGQFIVANMLEATRVIQSKDIPALSHADSLDEPPVTIPEE
jgi:hypothetical protein